MFWLLCSNSIPASLISIMLLIGVFAIPKGSALLKYISHLAKSKEKVGMVTCCASNLASQSNKQEVAKLVKLVMGEMMETDALDFVN